MGTGESKGCESTSPKGWTYSSSTVQGVCEAHLNYGKQDIKSKMMVTVVYGHHILVD